MDFLKHIPDYKLIEAANSNMYNNSVDETIDDELEERFQSIREELEAYEKYQQFDDMLLLPQPLFNAYISNTPNNVPGDGTYYQFNFLTEEYEIIERL
jgi:hypothetical protein